MSGEQRLSFRHRFVASPESGAPTLLLLHGTGAENDMLPLRRRLAPGVNLLSPRGRVLENGMPRFFRRLAVGVFDVDDLGVEIMVGEQGEVSGHSGSSSM